MRHNTGSRPGIMMFPGLVAASMSRRIARELFRELLRQYASP